MITAVSYFVINAESRDDETQNQWDDHASSRSLPVTLPGVGVRFVLHRTAVQVSGVLSIELRGA